MKVLVLGAGATGGYFGGRMLEAGRDVTFLVRERRAALLRANGLMIRSPLGNVRLKPHLCVGHARDHYDLVVLACKSYDLDSALGAIAPAVGPDTAILPLLNGMHHFDVLDERFGPERVLGGLCSIGAALSSDGAIEHLSELHVLRYGERDLSRTPRIEALDALFKDVKADARCSSDILQALWEKWVMLASMASMTCLMRANVGEIVASPGGRELMLQVLDECLAIAAAYERPPRPDVLDGTQKMLTEKGSKFRASMLRDIEAGGRIEVDHVIGDIIARAEAKDVPTPLLRMAFTHMKAYEARQKMRK